MYSIHIKNTFKILDITKLISNCVRLSRILNTTQWQLNTD